ncbi:MAG: hypothetical protein AAF376_18050 [Pseudomonadota bacterium]
MTTNMLSLNALLRLARDTVSNPQEGASTVLSFAPPMRALWLMFALVVVLSLFLGEVVLLVSGPLEEGPLTGAYSSPLALGLIQAAYRGVQDGRTAIRFFKKTVAEDGNPYGIDDSKITMWGNGTGGYLVLGVNGLSFYNEIPLAANPSGKFLLDVNMLGSQAIDQLY